MKIKIKIILLFTIFLVSLISLLVINQLNSQTVLESLDKQDTMNLKILNAVSDLSILSNDYLLHRNDRSIEQWNSRYDSIQVTLKHQEHSHTHTEEEIRLLEKILEEHVIIKGIFSKLTENDLSKELEERLVSQLLINLNSMYDQASQIAKISNDQVGVSQRRAYFLNLIFITLIFVIVSFGAYISFRAVSVPVNKLFQATKKLEKGNFKTRVDIKTKDEFEKLGSSFNKTVASLGKINEERQQINKAKTELLSIASHELRSPMTPIKGQLQMLMTGYSGKLNNKQKEAMGIIVKNINQIDDVIVDFLEVSRIEAGRFEFNLAKVNLTKSITEQVEKMKLFMPEKKVTLAAKIGPLTTITTDLVKVMKVLKNILSNSIKFSKTNGKVEVVVRKKGKTLLFIITDYGIGIKPEHQKKIFKPFFQGEKTMYRKYGGTGLGLPVSKGIINSLGGKIWFKSKLGEGTTFYFTIPLTPPKDVKSPSKTSKRK
jgi:signal transduction histidine kinase